jgi:hypothetical protein
VLAPNQRKNLSELGIKSLIGGTIACLMTAVIAECFTMVDIFSFEVFRRRVFSPFSSSYHVRLQLLSLTLKQKHNV